MTKNTLLLICALSVSFTKLSAQIVKTIHQAFPMEESQTKIHIALDYPYQYETWSGDYVLVETTISLSNASNSLLEFLQKTGRYNTVQHTYQSETAFKLKQMNRRAIQTSKGLCEENILITIYVPERLRVNEMVAAIKNYTNK